MVRNIYWAEKYRPKTLGDICGQQSMVRIIKRLLENKEDFPHIILHGPPGTGKTTMAFVIARELYGNNFMSFVKYVNASLERKLENIKEIEDFARARTILDSPVKFKLIILDEADYLAPLSQPSLRSLMENLADNCKFIITCNYPNRIIPAIRSRATEIAVRKATPKAIEQMIDRVVDGEGIEGMDGSIKKMLVRYANGDFRRLINALQAATVNGKISRKSVADVTSMMDKRSLARIFKVLHEKGVEDAIKLVQEYMRRGILPESVLDAAFEMCMDRGLFGTDKSMPLLELFAEAAGKLTDSVHGMIVVPWFIMELDRLLE